MVPHLRAGKWQPVTLAGDTGENPTLMSGDPIQVSPILGFM